MMHLKIKPACGALLAAMSILLAWPCLVSAEPAPTAAELGLMIGSPPPADKIVTLENFLQPPYNRWSLMHLRELVPTRNVAVTGPPAALPRRPVDLSGLRVDLGSGRTVTVGDWLPAAYTDGFIVLHHGNVVFERYYNGETAAMQHLMWSVTKSFTGTMMLALMEQGLVDANERVDHYVPELAGTAFGDATVQQMLDMTNSIDYNEEYYNPDADITGFLNAMLPGGEGLYANLQGLKKKNPNFAHGEAFHYVTPDPDVLGWIIRRVTGENLAQVLQRLLWSKLGAEHEAYYWLDPFGVEMAGWRPQHQLARCRAFWPDDPAGRLLQRPASHLERNRPAHQNTAQCGIVFPVLHRSLVWRNRRFLSRPVVELYRCQRSRRTRHSWSVYLHQFGCRRGHRQAQFRP